jgi:hypothetical protein
MVFPHRIASLKQVLVERDSSGHPRPEYISGMEVPASHTVFSSPISLWLNRGVLLVAVAMFWPRPARVDVGLDNGWRAALHLAAGSKAFGSEVLATYGPLGYLSVPAPYSDRWRLALVCSGLVFVVTALWLARVFRAAFPRAGSVLAAVGLGLGAAPFFTLGWTEVVANLACAATIVASARGRLDGLWMHFAVGSFLLLVKVNDGLQVLVVGVVIAVVHLGWPKERDGSADRWPGLGAMRTLAVSVMAAALTLVGGWVFAGQSLSGLPGFLRGSLEVTSGYSSSMSLLPSRRGALGLVVLLGAAVFVVWWGRLPRLASAVWLLFVYKHGVVRADDAHVLSLALALLFVAGAAAALVERPPRDGVRSRDGTKSSRAIASVVVGAVLLSTGGTAALGQEFLSALPLRAGSGLPDAVRALGGRRPEATEGESRILTTLQVDQVLVDEVRRRIAAGETLEVSPADTTVVWALSAGEAWRPVPTLQSFSTYSRWLDERSAAALRSDDTAPTMILYRFGEVPGQLLHIDQRSPIWEQPLTVHELLCRYASEQRAGPWVLLIRRQSVCGASSDVAQVQNVDRRFDLETAVKRVCPGWLTFSMASGVSFRTTLIGTFSQVPPMRLSHPKAALDAPRRDRVLPEHLGSPLIIGGRLPSDWNALLNVPVDPPAQLQLSVALGPIGRFTASTAPATIRCQTWR